MQDRGFFIVKKNFTLGKTERLKSRKSIEDLFADGKRLTVAPFRITYLFVKEAGLQSGFAVTVKSFKKATDRNRVKRLMREAYRLQKNELASALERAGKGLHIFFIYTGTEMPVYGVVYDAIGQALKKMLTKVNENISPHT
jgi:ribonuclease P protein component